MDIIKLTRDLGTEFQKEKAYLNMMKQQSENDKDEELQELIGEFNLKRMSLNAQMSKKEEEKDNDKINEIDKEVRDLYQKIMANDNMKKYNLNKREVDVILSKIYKILNAAAMGQDPQTVNVEENSSCGGSCSSCSGCH